MEVAAGQVIIKAGQDADELLIVRSGVIVREHADGGVTTLKKGGANAREDYIGEGGVAHFQELVLWNGHGRLPKAPATLRAVTAATIYRIPAQAFHDVAAAHGHEFSRALSHILASEIQRHADVLEESDTRMRLLTPYQVPAPKHSILGVSRQSERLRTQVAQATQDPHRRPVLVTGEPGLGKASICALIHYGATMQQISAHPIVRLNCERLGSGGSELFGRGTKPGLLSLLKACPPGTSLLLEDVHLLPPDLVPRVMRLVRDGTWATCDTPVANPLALLAVDSLSVDEGCSTQNMFFSLAPGSLRILMTADQPVPELEAVVSSHLIKVAPLRARPSDIRPLVDHALARAACRKAGSHQAGSVTDTSDSDDSASGGEGAASSAPHLQISDGAMRRMQAYSWPGNEEELRATVLRAAREHLAAAAGKAPPPAPAAAAGAQAAQGTASTGLSLHGSDLSGAVLGEHLMWFGSSQLKSLRVDLFAVAPGLRELAKQGIWPNVLNDNITPWVFPLAVAALMFGPQDRESNPVLNFFWCWWWPGIFALYPFVGRIWCAVCPFMVMGDVAQKAKQSMGGTVAKWPRAATLEAAGPPFLLALFAGILVWEEVWDLPNSAALSGWLLLLISAGAVVCSVMYERRLWCRYLCPIGGMNGLFAKGSATELRARQGVCAGNCKSYACINGTCGTSGSPSKLDTAGCPMNMHPAQLQDNKNCTLCMSCVKACPNTSAEFRLRLPLSDLWEEHEPSWGELGVLFLLLGAAALHSLDAGHGTLAAQLHAGPELAAGVSWAHLGLSAAVLALPAAAVWGVDTAGRWWARHIAKVPEPAPLLSIGYGYLPLVWAATLSHYSDALMQEGGQVLQVAARTLGASDVVVSAMPAFSFHPAVVTFVSGCTLLVGWAASMATTRHLAASSSWLSAAPHFAMLTLIMCEMWALDV